jgi:hypothetical protein
LLCKTERNYDANQSKVVDKTVNGFDALNLFISSSLGTTIYGTLILGKTKKYNLIDTHVRPSVSYGYNQALKLRHLCFRRKRNYDKIFPLKGGYELGLNNSTGFDLSNTFEAKVKDKDSTKSGTKKIMLNNKFIN